MKANRQSIQHKLDRKNSKNDIRAKSKLGVLVTELCLVEWIGWDLKAWICTLEEFKD
jgi:hypothetical protein